LENEAILTDVINKDEYTPLHYACDLGKLILIVSKEMMLFFIFNGVDVNVKNKDGKKAGEGNADSKMFMNKILEEVAVINF
jgi:ankyrin repeat protein